MRSWTRSIVLSLAAATSATLSMLPSPAAADRSGEDHLPNLRTRRLHALHITHEGGATLLRFTNTIANVGDGPLELRPENVGETTTAYQRIFTHDDATLGWELTDEREVGTFVFHPQHDHWHFEAFAEYRLYEVAGSGGIGEVLREADDKVSFCVADTVAVTTGLAHAATTPGYATRCTQNAIQGISVGWADRYDWRLYGQWVDISGLPDGVYWLASTADPLDLIDETKERDNRKALKIRIIGDDVVRLSSARRQPSP